MFSYNEGGAFNFLIDCSPATLMELAFTAGSLWSLTHQMHLYLVTAGTQGQLLRHLQYRPSPAESLARDSASLSSRRGRIREPSLIGTQARTLSLMLLALEMHGWLLFSQAENSEDRRTHSL